LKATAV